MGNGEIVVSLAQVAKQILTTHSHIGPPPGTVTLKVRAYRIDPSGLSGHLFILFLPNYLRKRVDFDLCPVTRFVFQA